MAGFGAKNPHRDMDRFAGAVIRHRKGVLALFAVACFVCALLFLTVRVNYNIADYLPPEAQSTKALALMDREFKNAMTNTYVSVNGVSLPEAIAIKHRLEPLEHITEVLWLDDVADITKPLEMSDKGLIENYYKEGAARFFVVIEEGFEKEGVAEIRAVIGEGGAITGQAADRDLVQGAAGKEVMGAVVILVPIIVVILILSTASWIEPLLFMMAIGVSVVVNMGTNAIFGSVSFLTNSVTPILQLAVSLDYAIFLLHSFNAHRKAGEGASAGADARGDNTGDGSTAGKRRINAHRKAGEGTNPGAAPQGDIISEAMRKAVKESFATVSASAATTLFGFLALVFMEFRIGADLGLSLAKGIVFSFVSVMVFLPALTLCLYKAIDRTKHREFLPAFANIHGILRRLAIPAVIIVALVAVPCFLAQSRTDFLYGYEIGEATGSGTPGSVWDDSPAIVLLVPKGDMAREGMLSDELGRLPHVTSVMSYAKTVGLGIPPGFLDSSITDQFYSENFARIIVYTDTLKEGDIAFGAVESITAAAEKYYPGEVSSVGQSVNLYDIKNVVQSDKRVTNLIAIIAIFMVLVFTLRSLALPFILLFTIEAAIWINLSIPYFTGATINYVGYLVLSTVQLGATVDYAILLTVTYMRNRRALPKKEAIHKSLGSSFRSILVSAAILSSAGFILALTSTNPIIYDIGMLLGRGALLSMLMVVVFLPFILTTFDGVIGRATYRSGFFGVERQIAEDRLG